MHRHSTARYSSVPRVLSLPSEREVCCLPTNLRALEERRQQSQKVSCRTILLRPAGPTFVTPSFLQLTALCLTMRSSMTGVRSPALEVHPCSRNKPANSH